MAAPPFILKNRLAVNETDVLVESFARS